MLKHYFTIALRNLWKSKLFTLINVAGLAIGMAACILIFVYVQYELSFDRFHKYGDRIYRVLTIDRAAGVSSSNVAITMPPFGPQVAMAFPEVESFCRMTSGQRQTYEIDATHKIIAEKAQAADSTFFDFFSFPLSKGDPKSALTKPFSIVLTKDLAKRLFNDSDPMGQILKTASGNEFTVTGITPNLPDNSHINFDALYSFSSLEVLAKRQPRPDTTQPLWVDYWQMLAIPTYIRLAPGTSDRAFLAKLTPYLRDKGVRENFEPNLQRFYDVHLKSSQIIFDGSVHKSDASSVYTMAAVALLILVIASVNFMNLSTARAASRAREVGLRKVVGSLRKQLVRQFLGESVLLAILAMILALSIGELFLPWLNQLTGYHLDLNFLTNIPLMTSLLLLIVIVGILAGSYPAAILSGFQPVDVLKGSFQHGKRGQILRRVLVVFQFALSIILICGTIIVNRQLHYIQTKDLGYHREQVLLIDLYNPKLQNTATALCNEIAQSSHVMSIGSTTSVPGRQFSRGGIKLENDTDADNRIWSQFSGDFDYIKTLGFEILKGRDFSREFPADTANSVIINEAAARDMGVDDPIGKKVRFGNMDTTGATVIGMVKDFHFASLREKIEPMIIGVSANPLATIAVRLKQESVTDAMQQITAAWKKVNPDAAFNYKFMDDEFNQIYASDLNFAKIGNTFTGLAVFIACLGLFGLASHTTEQRRKEIGIRKVLGASVFSISRLLVMDYIRWVAIANIVAWPVAFWVSQRWLDSFAYHVDLTWIPFVVSGLLAMAIAVITVLGHALHAATSNPVNALRYE